MLACSKERKKKVSRKIIKRLILFFFFLLKVSSRQMQFVSAECFISQSRAAVKASLCSRKLLVIPRISAHIPRRKMCLSSS